MSARINDYLLQMREGQIQEHTLFQQDLINPFPGVGPEQSLLKILAARFLSVDNQTKKH